MAEKRVLECDKATSGCRGDVRSVFIWWDGAKEATRVDLCDTHARPITEMEALGTVDGLPSKPRATMEVTPLRTTAATRHLKRHKPAK